MQRTRHMDEEPKTSHGTQHAAETGVKTHLARTAGLLSRIRRRTPIASKFSVTSAQEPVSACAASFQEQRPIRCRRAYSAAGTSHTYKHIHTHAHTHRHIRHVHTCRPSPRTSTHTPAQAHTPRSAQTHTHTAWRPQPPFGARPDHARTTAWLGSCREAGLNQRVCPRRQRGAVPLAHTAAPEANEPLPRAVSVLRRAAPAQHVHAVSAPQQRATR